MALTHHRMQCREAQCVESVAHSVGNGGREEAEGEGVLWAP